MSMHQQLRKCNRCVIIKQIFVSISNIITCGIKRAEKYLPDNGFH